MSEDLGDRMRKNYRELGEHEKWLIESVKQYGEEFYGLLEGYTQFDKREGSIAKTKLEEAVMWAVKAITAEKV